MGISLSRAQILVLVLVLVSLLVLTLTVIHGAAPGLWHTFTAGLFAPNVIPRHT